MQYDVEKAGVQVLNRYVHPGEGHHEIVYKTVLEYATEQQVRDFLYSTPDKSMLFVVREYDDVDDPDDIKLVVPYIGYEWLAKYGVAT